MELLMPAGSLEKLKYAIYYGADAVYAGVPYFSLRARENEFDYQNLKTGIDFAHSMGKKVYLTSNIFARNYKIKPFLESLPRWMELKPDALIMSDPGLISMTKELYPEVEIHLSVQANCMNWQSVRFWQKQGVSRVILSRELRITEIQEIKQKVPDMELEAFVHGSICIAYSGRCLLSHYMSYRDANQGVCDNSCRYGYKIHEFDPQKKPDFSMEVNKTKDQEYYLEDLRDPGQFYQIDEDENGTYIMNSKDLCAIEYIKELKDAGVVSFKVEGRTKSVHYAAHVSKIYRQAIDDVIQNRPFNVQLLTELNKVANRGYHKGFLMGQPTFEAQNYKHSVSRECSQRFAGLVLMSDLDSVSGETSNSKTKKIKVDVRNKINVGDHIEIIGPKNNLSSRIVGIRNPKNEITASGHGGAGVCEVELDQELSIEPYSMLSIL